MIKAVNKSPLKRLFFFFKKRDQKTGLESFRILFEIC